MNSLLCQKEAFSYTLLTSVLHLLLRGCGYNYDSTAIRQLFDSLSTAIRPLYDHSTIYVTTGLLYCGLNK